MPLPTAPRRGQWKGLALAGVALAGLMAGEAHAKWIKATVTGNIAANTPTTANNLESGNAITLYFYIQNYSGSPGTPNIWRQTNQLSNYTQLFGYGTGTGSTGLSGNYNASLAPGGLGNVIQSNNDGSSFLMRVQGDPTGLSVTRESTQIGVSNIALSGALVGFNKSFPSSADVVDFLSGSLATSSYNCTGTCSGQIQIPENPITFTWTSIQFDQIEPVPAPLPIFGAFAAFSFSRKLRERLASR
jgi:hypothetical protein